MRTQANARLVKYSYKIIKQVKKLKLFRYRHACAEEERQYSSYSFLNSALDGVSGQRDAQAALYPRGKDPRYPLNRRLVWTQRLEDKLSRQPVIKHRSSSL
jgi:hypothetical protein